MTSNRPARPPAGAVTDAVRRAILAEAMRRGVSPQSLLTRHADAEYLAGYADIVSDVERRYQMPPSSLMRSVLDTMAATMRMPTDHLEIVQLFNDAGATFILFVLPDTEFLTVLEHTRRPEPNNEDTFDVEMLFRFADEALRARGAPYRRAVSEPRFEWVGDPAQHALTVQPALLALADERLNGARDEFEEALSKRRKGTPKDLEAAVGYAAKSVESVLVILHEQKPVALPASRKLSTLFNSLASPTVGLLPGYLDHVVCAAGGPRNNMASHGQGSSVREVPEELADASIAAAAVAITLLAHYLP